ncbi:hypothetical protein POJ06DRAFT_131589 [Lipomyces tetrasporus]|uniref:BTB domain-containing protein n=1 Tax=Lipomyces tetrasporus TaxID=54092 RepID=A0AAD7QPZ8_9ASCO|nr:uncharacterized protein POJ06DRAFT_131589 [Lipomyces tetrasporus]KAJ8099254.1 hypothetical protein POJ06DRAFT_131589 [Lipomyces tetrasporus]
MAHNLFKFYYQDDILAFEAAVENILAATDSKRGANGKDVNRTDEYGRTILHLACSQNKIEFVSALCKCPGLDILATDLESGWTALHRALYAGNVAIAQLLIAANRDSIRVKDREGNSPFDVLNSTIEGTNPLPLDLEVGGSELFTFGSNANHTLGFHDSDDRANPERVYLERPRSEDRNEPAVVRFRELRIRDVQMSKLHTAVLTTDPTDNLYICGFGNGGRLGFATGGTQFTFKNLPKFGNAQVAQVALSQDHTLVVTADGDCYSWGSNKFGQLGYQVETKKPQEEPVQHSPRKVVAGLKREHVIGVAASRVHSVAFTDQDLFMWGKNVGQLGFPTAEGSAVEMYPRKVPSLPGPVKMATAIDNATICLLANNDVIVYLNGGYFKVNFPLERFADQFSVFRPRAMFARNAISKVVSGGHTVCALSSLGDVYSFHLDGKAIENTKSNLLSKSIRPQNVWSLRRKHLAVRDLDVGQDGSVIICTESGSVWRKTKRVATKDSHGKVSEYKFTRISHLTKVVTVRSNMFGAFAAIRSDSIAPPISIDEHDLADDIERLIAFVDEYDPDVEDSQSVISDRSAESDYERRPPRTYLSTLKLLQDEDLPSIILERFEELEMEGTGGYDLYFVSPEANDILIPVNQVIIAARSKILMGLITRGQQVEGIEYSVMGGKPVLKFANAGLLALLIFVYFSYTDCLLPIWEGFASKAQIAKRFIAAKEDLIKLSSVLKLKSLSSAAYFLQKPPRLLSSDLYALMENPAAEEWTDMVVHLEDRDVRCHSVILSSRSEFFETLMAMRWSAPVSMFASSDYELSSSPSPDKKDKSVDMKHVRYAVFKIILDFMYGKDPHTLFDGIRAESLTEFLEFVLEVLAAANEMLIDKLTQVCQAVLLNYVNVRNAADLLAEADLYSAEGLKTSVLKYISMNLECMLENGHLGSLDEALMADLEKVVREKQIEKLPISKSGLLLELLEERNPSLTEARRKERDRLVSVFGTSLPSSYGSLRQSSLPSSLTGNPFDRRPHESGSASGGHVHIRRRRRSSKEASTASQTVSPVLRPSNPPSDFIFDMEDEPEPDWTVVKGKSKSTAALPASALASSPAAGAFYDSPMGQTVPSSSFKDHNLSSTPTRQDYFAGSLTPHGSLSSTPVGSLGAKHSLPTHPSTSIGLPWAPVAPKVASIDFKSAISQADLQARKQSPMSAISLGLQQSKWKEMPSPQASQPSSSSPAVASSLSSTMAPTAKLEVKPVEEHSKISQKERKKLQRQHTDNGVTPTSTKVVASSSSSSPWQTPIKADVRAKSILKASGDDTTVVSSPQLFPMGPQTSFATTAAQNVSSAPGVVKKKPSVGGASGMPSALSSGLNSGASTANSSRKGSPSPQTPTRSASGSGPMPRGAIASNPSPSSVAKQPVVECQFSLAEIIEQQRIEQEIITAKATQKKSFQELREEEEFATWWAAESERVQLEMQRQEAAAKAGESKRGGRGGRGGAGRGRGVPGRGGRGGFWKAGGEQQQHHHSHSQQEQQQQKQQDAQHNQSKK